jgi:tetratricopeptide (TPR) repeat protein/nucleoside-triphosphatase THEP1
VKRFLNNSKYNDFIGGQVTSKLQVLAEPILVGREKELEELQGFLNTAIKGKGQMVFVSGEAGVGKTRLIHEFLNVAKKQAVAILTGWCLSNATVPYFPFFEAFRKYFSDEGNIEELNVKNWLLGPPQRKKMGNLQVVTPQVWKDQTFAAVASALISISTKNPVILFIDDLHWADSASLALIHYLANIINSEKVLIIATFRTEQLAADNDGRPHPLLETLRLMRRQDLIKEINVLSLDETGISILVKSMLCGSLQQEFAQKLTEESQGNPLFIVESIRMLYESNSLVQEHGIWHLISTSIEIPQKIKDIILQRLDSLPNNQRNVLEAAAIIGVEFDPMLLATVLSRDSIEIIEILDIVANGTCLIRCLGQFYGFDHANTRETIYNDISPALRRAYHAKTAEKLEIMSKDDKLLLSNIAFHYAQAGNKGKAVKYALAAGQSALSKWSNKEAVEHFAFVLQAVGKEPEYKQEKLIAIEGLGDAYYAGNNFKEATETFEQLVGLQDDVAKLRALRKAAWASFYQGDIPRERALIHKAEGIAAADRLEAALILKQKAELAGMDNDWVTALRITDEALKIFQEEYALSDTARTLMSQGYIAANLGQLEKSVAAALRSIALYGDIEDFRAQMEAYAYAGGTFQACTLVEDSNRLLARAVQLNEEKKIWDYIRIIPVYVFWPMGLLGKDPASSISKALKGLEISEKTDSNLYLGGIYAVLTVASALAEDPAHVEEYFGKLLKLPQHVLSNAASQILLGSATGVYHVVKNEFEKSKECFDEILARAKSLPPFFEASTRQLFAWALGKQGKVEEAKAQLFAAQKVIETAKERFEHVNVQASLMTLRHPEVDQAFEIRLDLVNVSRSQGSIVKVENMTISEFQIVRASPNCLIRSGQIKLKDEAIRPFEVKTVKLTVKATKPSTFNLAPSLTFKDDANEKITTCIIEPVKIVIHAKACPEQPALTTPTGVLPEFEFKTQSAKKAFDFLISAFVQDYMRRRLPLEWSGWRTLIEIVKQTHISRHSVYGDKRSRGRAISELEQRGLVEARIFPKERGRGGEITKVRVFYERETVKRRIDRDIAKPYPEKSHSKI